MKSVKDVIKEWDVNAQAQETIMKVPVHLAVRDVGRIRALCELYPGFTEERVITDLITAALDEVEEALPYVKGTKIVAEDEFGDPVFEDIGMTPRFEKLTDKYTKMLESELKKQ